MLPNRRLTRAPHCCALMESSSSSFAAVGAPCSSSPCLRFVRWPLVGGAPAEGHGVSFVLGVSRCSRHRHVLRLSTCRLRQMSSDRQPSTQQDTRVMSFMRSASSVMTGPRVVHGTRARCGVSLRCAPSLMSAVVVSARSGRGCRRPRSGRRICRVGARSRCGLASDALGLACPLALIADRLAAWAYRCVWGGIEQRGEVEMLGATDEMMR